MNAVLALPEDTFTAAARADQARATRTLAQHTDETTRVHQAFKAWNLLFSPSHTTSTQAIF